MPKKKFLIITTKDTLKFGKKRFIIVIKWSIIMVIS